MTVIDAGLAYQAVEAPNAVPYRFGLFSVVDFTAEDRYELGIEFESQVGGTPRATLDECIAEAQQTLLTDDFCNVPTFDPFSVYLLDTDSIAGIPFSEHAQRARERFSLVEQYGAEAAFEDYLAATAGGAETLPTTVSSPTEKAEALIATLEEAVADLAGVEGVIYIGRKMALLGSGMLERQGGQLRTKLGTRVAAFGGGALDDTGYATGPIKGVRGPIETFDGTHALSTNDVSIVVLRTYAIGHDPATVLTASVTW